MPAPRIQAWESRFARAFADPVGLYQILYAYQCPPYLAEVLRCPAADVVWSACPACLKTTAIVINALHKCLTRPFVAGRPHKHLILAPLESHLSVVWNESLERINDSELLRGLLRQMPGRQQPIQRDPNWRIHWFNGSMLEFCISGPSGEPFFGRHVDGIDIDEAERFPMRAVPPMQTRRNPGCQLRVYGMVDGVRDTYLYRAHVDDTFERFVTKRYDSPLWNEAEAHRLERQWGRQSPEWQWYVEARWDVQAEAPFDLETLSACMRLSEPYQPLEIAVEDFRNDYGSEPEAVFGGLPTVPGARVILAADIGETASPSNIGVFFLDQPRQDGGICDRMDLRIALHRFEAYERSKCFDYLARHYRAAVVAIDVGAAGSAVVSNLMNPELFPNRRYEDVVLPVDFRKRVEMARIGIEEPPSHPSDFIIEQAKSKDPKPTTVEQPIKHATTKWLRERFFLRMLSLPHDYEMWDEFQLHRVVGGMRYTDPQHTIDMLRCYAFARHHLDTGGTPQVDEGYMEVPDLLPVWAGPNL